MVSGTTDYGEIQETFETGAVGRHGFSPLLAPEQRSWLPNRPEAKAQQRHPARRENATSRFIAHDREQERPVMGRAPVAVERGDTHRCRPDARIHCWPASSKSYSGFPTGYRSSD